MSFENWIALLSSVVGMAAAIAAMVAVFEMRRQRRSSYKPDIALVAPNWNLCVSGESFSTATWQFNRGDLEAKELLLKDDIQFQLFNVGAGSAKDLVVRFSYDIREFIQALEIMEETRWSIEYDGRLLKLKEKDQYKRFDVVSNQEYHRRIAYLLPASTQPDGISLSLPSGYGLLLKAYYLSLSQADKEIFEKCELPLPIDITIQWLDIEGNKQTTVFRLQPEFNVISRPQLTEGSSIIASGFINIS